MVLTDKKSKSSEEDVTRAIKPLEDAGIVVIPVAVGNERDVKELESITTDPENIILSPERTNPEELAKKIMYLIQIGKTEF